MKTNIKWPIGLITKYSTQLLNIHKAIYMNIHVRVYLLHAYMHSGNFARGWGQGPIFLFSRGFQLFSGERGSNCYFIKKRVDFPGWVVRTSSPLWTCAQPIYMCLCIKPLNVAGSIFFSKDIGFYSLLKILCRKNHYFIAFVLGSTSRNH